ncbi:MAG: anaerobic sulfatase maturase [Eubacterium sp.]|nr:anaerobic sulfatase maturase [Eubacterium sp.]
MKFLSILIKPVSGMCNIDCKYCFYKEIALYPGKCARMSDEVMKKLIDRALETEADEILFAFQGGEPLLAGAEYYRDFIKYVSENNKSSKIAYSVQTNGMLINDEYVEIFKENNFLVGISIDGPKFVHDKYRLKYDGNGTYENVISNAKKLMNAGVEVNVLSVITGEGALKAKKIYEFYKKNGFYFTQFIPCMDPINEVQGSGENALTTDKYYTFLSELFELWYEDFMSGEYISIRHFDNWVRMVMGERSDMCSLTGVCGSYFVCESDGNIYPCDFYVSSKYLLGNIVTDSFEHLFKSLNESGFLKEAAVCLSPECKECKNFDLCRGGCKRDWVRDGNTGKSRYCSALDRFFNRYRSKMLQIASVL